MKSIENSEIKAKVSTASSFTQMIRILDSHFGNSQMIASKIFSELQQLSKPSQYDFEQENKNIVKISSYFAFLQSTGHQEISIFESQAICA